jgi:hypothetical protein
MKTAKDLAWKAYLDGMQKDYPVKIDENEIKERFENWWKEWYYHREHKNSFNPEFSVFIEGKRYIQAE